MTTAAADTDTRHWAWPWLMGASLGMSTVGGYFLLVYFRGWPWGWELACSLWLTVFGGYPFLYHTLTDLPRLAGAFKRGWAEADDDQAGDDGAPGPGDSGRSVSPLVGGYLLDEREQFYYDGLLRLFQHAAAAGSLTSTALIPAAFTDPAHWGYWTNLAAKSGLCLKANGVTTVLPAGRTYAWAVGEIRRGNLIWPAGDDPARQPLPHPFSAGLTYKADVGKAEKAGPKAGKVVDDDD